MGARGARTTGGGRGSNQYRRRGAPSPGASRGSQAQADSIRQSLLKMAASPAAPPELLRSLADHEDQDVRAALASNTALPQDMLGKLALSDESQKVRRRAVANKSASEQLLLTVAKRDLDSDAGHVAWLRLPPKTRDANGMGVSDYLRDKGLDTDS